MLHSHIGQVAFAGYLLDKIGNSVPGKWRIEIWSGDRKLAVQTFTLVGR